MLARMEISVELLKRAAALGGFDWSEAELEPIRPAVERLLEALARLEQLPLDNVEPTMQYRVI
jgi:Asp-tRNA(Asn)/Glu-tRNA(Gln) amidotransferase C subunit